MGGENWWIQSKLEEREGDGERLIHLPCSEREREELCVHSLSP